MEDETKKCSKCKLHFPATPGYFYASKVDKSGLHTYCKTCMKAHRRKNYQDNHGRAAISKGRKVYDPLLHGEDLSAEAEYMFQHAGIVPEGWYECRKCGKVKRNLRKFFPLQPGRYRTAEGERLFSSICRSCKRQAKRRRKHEREMEEIHEYNPQPEDPNYYQEAAEATRIHEIDPRVY